jgi:hypothetical protein
VLFKEFIKHYRKLTDEQIVADVRQSMDDLEELVDGTTSFGSKMVRWSMERADRYPQASENGKKGGRPRKDKESTAVAPTREGVEFKPGSGNAVKLESATPAKPSLAYSGKNGLVRLTDDEYALLLQELGNKRKADRLIDDLDYKLAEGATFRQPHMHVLTHWQSYREDKAAEAAETAKARAAANAEAFGNVDRRTPFQKNQDELHQLYVLTSEKLKEVK